jgi:hypothetical protein
MSSPFSIPASKVLGADFLCFLLTPECVDPNAPPTEEQWQVLDFARYGKTETQIKHFLEQKAQGQSKQKQAQTVVSGLTHYFYADLLNQAMSQGLIYRLNNPQEDGKAYYGIPSHVRQTLSLEWRPEMDVSETCSNLAQVKGNRNLWIDQLRSFLKQAAAAEYPEICEYAAQMALNALQQQDLQTNEIPASLKQLAQTLGLVPVPHYAGLTILLEACRETMFFKQARQLCDSAVDAHLLPAEDVDAVLQPTTLPHANPFMALF